MHCCHNSTLLFSLIWTATLLSNRAAADGIIASALPNSDNTYAKQNISATPGVAFCGWYSINYQLWCKGAPVRAWISPVTAACNTESANANTCITTSRYSSMNCTSQYTCDVTWGASLGVSLADSVCLVIKSTSSSVNAICDLQIKGDSQPGLLQYFSSHGWALWKVVLVVCLGAFFLILLLVGIIVCACCGGCSALAACCCCARVGPKVHAAPPHQVAKGGANLPFPPVRDRPHDPAPHNSVLNGGENGDGSNVNKNHVGAPHAPPRRACDACCARLCCCFPCCAARPPRWDDAHEMSAAAAHQNEAQLRAQHADTRTQMWAPQPEALHGVKSVYPGNPSSPQPGQLISHVAAAPPPLPDGLPPPEALTMAHAVPPGTAALLATDSNGLNPYQQYQQQLVREQYGGPQQLQQVQANGQLQGVPSPGFVSSSWAVVPQSGMSAGAAGQAQPQWPPAPLTGSNTLNPINPYLPPISGPRLASLPPAPLPVGYRPVVPTVPPAELSRMAPPSQQPQAQQQMQQQGPQTVMRDSVVPEPTLHAGGAMQPVLSPLQAQPALQPASQPQQAATTSPLPALMQPHSPSLMLQPQSPSLMPALDNGRGGGLPALGKAGLNPLTQVSAPPLSPAGALQPLRAAGMQMPTSASTSADLQALRPSAVEPPPLKPINVDGLQGLQQVHSLAELQPLQPRQLLDMAAAIPATAAMGASLQQPQQQQQQQYRLQQPPSPARLQAGEHDASLRPFPSSGMPQPQPGYPAFAQAQPASPTMTPQSAQYQPQSPSGSVAQTSAAGSDFSANVRAGPPPTMVAPSSPHAGGWADDEDARSDNAGSREGGYEQSMQGDSRFVSRAGGGQPQAAGGRGAGAGYGGNFQKQTPVNRAQQLQREADAMFAQEQDEWLRQQEEGARDEEADPVFDNEFVRREGGGGWAGSSSDVAGGGHQQHSRGRGDGGRAVQQQQQQQHQGLEEEDIY